MHWISFQIFLIQMAAFIIKVWFIATIKARDKIMVQYLSRSQVLNSKSRNREALMQIHQENWNRRKKSHQQEKKESYSPKIVFQSPK